MVVARELALRGWAGNLGNMHFLEAQPMVALHLRLRGELLELPREHVFFTEAPTRYRLSIFRVCGRDLIASHSSRFYRATMLR